MAGKLLRWGRELQAAPFCGVTTYPGADWAMRLITSEDELDVDAGMDVWTEATFTGYAQIAFTPEDAGGSTNDGDDVVVLLRGEPFVWDCTALPQTITGWVLVDNGADKPIAYELYAVPDVLEIGSRHTLYASIRVGACG